MPEKLLTEKLSTEKLPYLTNPAIVRLKIDPEKIRELFEALAHPTWYQHSAQAKDAFSVAKKNNHFVLAAFLMNNCPHCHDLQQEVFSQWKFGFWSIRKGLVLLSLDSHEDLAFCQKYNVSGYPTVILFNPDGTERGRVVGYASGTGVDAWINWFENATGMNASTP